MIPLFLDTDIGTDVDDALALGFALRHPGIDLLAVTTVSGDASLRARIAAKILQTAGRSDVEVAAGASSPPAGSGRIAWLGHEGEGILEQGESVEVSRRDAATLLVKESDGRSVVATIGPQSNLAAAMDRDPSLPQRVPRLIAMGGSFHPVRIHSGFVSETEDNFNFDPPATLRSMKAGIPTTLVPFDVTVRTFLTGEDLERLRGEIRCAGSSLG